MLASARILRNMNLNLKSKWPSLKEACKLFLSKYEFEEKHRALYDAQVEAKLLFEIFKNKNFVEIEFSRELADVYKSFTEKPYNEKNVNVGFEHLTRNADEAYHYLVTKFPLHHPKSRNLLKVMNQFPLGCGKISIIDLGCGPFTFCFGFLDEILNSSVNFGGGSYGISILGIDRSFYSLNLGSELMDDFKKRIEHLNISLEYKIIYDDGNFDDIINQIYEWLKKNQSHYMYLAYSASMSSGLRNFSEIIELLMQYSTEAILNICVIEPDKYSSGLSIDLLQHNFPRLTVIKRQCNISCMKPIGMVHRHKAIISNYQAITLQNPDIFISELTKNFTENFTEDILLVNKINRWILHERLVDFVGIYLVENQLRNTFSILKNLLPNLKNQNFLRYKVQKGLKPDKYRDFTLVPYSHIILSMIILSKIGNSLDNALRNQIYCSRFCEVNRLDRFYKFFTIGYTEFSNFEFKPQFRGTLLCSADIKRYFDSIDRELLLKNLSELFRECKINQDYIPIILKCLGEQKGIPIGSPLSSLIANLFLIDIDSEILKHPFVLDYARYMDDLKIILKPIPDKITEDDFKKFLKDTLKKYQLVLKEDKFKINKITYTGIRYLYNHYFQNLSEQYFDLLNPIKYGLALLLNSLIKNSINIKQNYKNLVNPISDILNKNGITFGIEPLYRYLILLNYKLRDPDFEAELVNVNKEKKIELIFPENILSLDDTKLQNQFINESRIWLVKCLSFARKMYNFLLEELLKWDELQNKLDKLESDITNEEREKILKYKESVLEGDEFTYSMRMIKYLTYRLTRIRYYRLYNYSNKVLKLIMKLIRLYFPIKIIGLLLYRYNHIALLKELLEKGIERFEERGELFSRKIYPNDIAYLIHLLGNYYELREDELSKDFEFWLNKMNIILISRPFEEKMAITEFTLRLNLINQIPYSKWISWYKQSDNLLVLKNILICIAFHNDSPEKIPSELQKLILDFYNYDECIVRKTLNLWRNIKIKKLENTRKLFEGDDIFQKIKVFPDSIDLDYELRSVFDWEEGFGGNFYY